MKTLLIIPIALLNAYINKKAIDNKLVGRIWHNVQFVILCVISYITIRYNYISLYELPLIMSLYYIFFEISLNLQRGKYWNYVGKTSQIDKTIQTIAYRMSENVFRQEANSRSLFVAIKLFMLFLSLFIYSYYQ